MNAKVLKKIKFELTYDVDDFVHYIETHKVVCITIKDAKKLHTLCNKVGISCKIDKDNKNDVVFDKAIVVTNNSNSNTYTLSIREVYDAECV